MSDGIVVLAQRVSFAYGDRAVLESVDLELRAGEVFGIVGPDGAGKSTLLRLLIGQLVPTAGSITVLGLPATDTSLRQRIAYMPQSFGQYLDLSVAENLEFFADLHGLESAAARTLIADLLARTGLSDFRNRRAAQLSGGMLQKLALACALVSRPQVMFLDEPTTGVDPLSRRAFWQLLDQVRAEHVAIVYATANMDEAERCDRVGLLVDGGFAQRGSPLDIVRRPTAPLLEVSGAGARAKRHAIRALSTASLVFPMGETLRVWVAGAGDENAFRAELASIAPALSVRRLRPSLHDVALHDLALAEGTGDGHADRQRH
ncbi:MAG TPA: ABC transporter ATP-binding protein [Casimicrobiaceae bacterium]|nr:ABC transporter ATP-binding protein [Casimicrobiaceae bacterium]